MREKRVPSVIRPLAALWLALVLAISLLPGAMEVARAADPAPGPAADEINGMVWLDVNGDGVNDATEEGFKGARVTLFDKDGNPAKNAAGQPVAPVVTGADGVYSFPGLDPADGPFSATVTRDPNTYPDPANWIISYNDGVVPYTGTDNGQVSVNPSDPRVGTLSNLTPGSTATVAMRPRPRLQLGQFGGGVQDGAAPFNTLGNCGSATEKGEPGDDCGDSNGQVRTGDLVSTSWSIVQDNLEDGTGKWGNVTFEQTIVPEDGADVVFAGVPPACNGTGAPASEIRNDYPEAGQTTLICNLGEFATGQQKSFTTSLRAKNSSPLRSKFTTKQRVYTGPDANRAIPAVADPIDPIEISSRPAFDLKKFSLRSATTTSRCVDTDNNPATPCENLQGYEVFTVAQTSTERKAGTSGLDQPYTFKEALSANKSDGTTPFDGLEYYIIECAPNTSTWGDTVMGSTGYMNSKPGQTAHGGGDCSYERDGNGPGDPYTMTVKNVDYNTDKFPTSTWGGQDLSAGPFIYTSHRIRFFVPLRSIDAENGSQDDQGKIKLYNRFAEFDPDGVPDVNGNKPSNYGNGFEPGYCADATSTCDPIPGNGNKSNNVVGPYQLELTVRGSMSKALYYRYDNWASGKYMPDSGYHTGSGLMEPNDYLAGRVTFSNSGTAELPDPKTCDVFDNTVYQLATADKIQMNSLQPEDPSSTYSYVSRYHAGNVNYADSADWPKNFKVEYAHLDISGDDPLYDPDRVGAPDVTDSTLWPKPDTFNQATGRFEGVWDGQRTATQCTDDAPAAGWKSDPNAVPGGIDAVNAVRVVPKDPNFGLPAGARIYQIVPLKVRDQFKGGPHDGKSIPSGTVMANYGTIASDSLTFNGVKGGWLKPSYEPGPENSSQTGDRSTFVRFNTKLEKRSIVPDTEIGQTGATLAGNQIVWEVIPSIQSTLVPATTVVQNVKVVDYLPPNTTYNPDCTEGLDTVTPVSVEDNVGPNGPAPGYTKLTYNLGNLPVNEAIRTIKICTDTNALAPDRTEVVNNAVLTADNDATRLETRSDDHTIRLEQTGSMKIQKTVDQRLDPLNDEQEYEVAYGNYAATFQIANPTLIDVFPWNGDGAGSASERDPASEYVGTLKLMGPPTVAYSDDSTGNIGKFYYTADAPNTINHNPDENKSGWCSTTDGTNWTSIDGATCPSSWGDVTAFKFVSDVPLAPDGNPKQGHKIKFKMKADGNDPGDLYTNRAGLDSTSLPPSQYLLSNPVTVRVAGFEVGDLIFGDLNRNGVYDANADVTAPEGVKVELYQTGQTPGTDTPVKTVTTNADGRYHFKKLSAGSYFAVIPASEFAAGGPLEGWMLQPKGLQVDPNTDKNETVDHHGIGITAGTVTNGVRTSGELELSASPPDNNKPPKGDEPRGDNVAGLPTGVPDDFTNFTLDIGLIPKTEPKLDVEKSTNGADADTGTGPWVKVGDEVKWRYEVTNTGDLALADVSLTDNAGTSTDTSDDWTMTKDADYVSGDVNNNGRLDPQEKWIFERTGTAAEGQYGNTVAAVGSPTDRTGAVIPDMDKARDSDDSHYHGATTGVVIEKRVQTDFDADTPTGPLVATGGKVKWTYVVTNTGNTALANVTVTDDVEGAVTCPLRTLPAGQQMTCSVEGTAKEGQYKNTGSVTGKPVDPDGKEIPNLDKPTASDVAHYFGSKPGINVVKTVQTNDANTAPGVWVSPGGDVVWDYTVTNTGNVPLSDVKVVDDNGTPGDPSDDKTLTLESGDTNGDGKLDVNETWIYKLAWVARDGQYTNLAVATGVGPATVDENGKEKRGESVSDDDPANYFGAAPQMVGVKKVNGEDANTAPGVYVTPGSTMNFTYTVKNIGNSPLSDVSVTDDKGVTVTCPETTLAAGAEMVCTGSAPAPAAGQYTNVGHFEAKGPDTVNPDGSTTDGVTLEDDDLANARVTVSLGDGVFHDLNNDGVRDAGEPGLAGVTVKLLKPDGTPATDYEGNPIAPVVTDADGRYEFNKLIPGDYVVEFTRPDGFAFSPADQGSDDGLDSDAKYADTAKPIDDRMVATARTGVIKVDAPVTDTETDGTVRKVTDPTIDCGFANLVSVGDKVWMDVDRDGIQDAGEPGAEGTKVRLLKPDGNGGFTEVATTTTGADGKYNFTGLVPGEDYVIEFVPKGPQTLVAKDAGSDDALDSDADPANGRVSFKSPASGKNSAATPDNSTIDAGVQAIDLAIAKKVTSTGPYYERREVTFELEASNVGPTNVLAGWKVTDVLPTGMTLVSVEADGADCDVATATCTFSDVLPIGESRTVKVSAKIDSDFVGKLKNVAYVAPSDADTPEINPLGPPPTSDTDTDSTPTDNDAQTTIEVLPLISVGDWVWVDVNRDGLQTDGEPGLAGVTVTITDADGNERTTKTDENGFWVIDDLTPGTEYTVKFTKPDGYSFTPAGAGDDRGADSDADVETGEYKFTTPDAGQNGTEPGKVDLPSIDAGMVKYNLTLSKKLVTQGVILVGSTVKFELVAHNDGPADSLAGWSVTDMLPANLTLVSMSGSGFKCTGGTCVAEGPLAANSDATITVVAKVTGTKPGGYANVAFVKPSDKDVPEASPLGEDPTLDTDPSKTPTDNDASAGFVVSVLIPLPETGGETGGVPVWPLLVVAAGAAALAWRHR